MENMIEVTGKTVDEAIQIGLKKLGATRDEVEVAVLQVETPRLFGLLGKTPAKIKLTYLQEDKNIAQRITSEILDLMGVDAEVSVREFDEEIYIDIGGGGDILIGQRGRTLDALQYLVSRIINDSRRDEEWTRLVIDVEGYRDRRTDTLENLAQKMAREAVEQARELATEPMTPHDRRIVHMTLKPNKDIQTFSRGQGNMRRVIISPKNATDKRNSGGDRKRRRPDRGSRRRKR